MKKGLSVKQCLEFLLGARLWDNTTYFSCYFLPLPAFAFDSLPNANMNVWADPVRFPEIVC